MSKYKKKIPGLTAEQLRQHRESYGFSPAEAADLCGVQQSTWYGWENKTNPVPGYIHCLLHYLRWWRNLEMEEAQAMEEDDA